ncbi:hypothetical protein B9S53_12695 [Arthrospira sp. O9.13F]|nr:hypothetical protein B9S53_12695 [Arthrospira sp. O9.13F]
MLRGKGQGVSSRSLTPYTYNHRENMMIVLWVAVLKVATGDRAIAPREAFMRGAARLRSRL